MSYKWQICFGPVIAVSQVTYEREAIVKYLKDNDNKLPGNSESSCA